MQSLPHLDSPRHNPVRPNGDRGFSVVELFIVATILLILAAIEIPNIWRARMAANQAAAVASTRAIESAEAIYATTYGQGYSASLAQLGPPAPGVQASADAAGLLDSRLAAGIKSGYRYAYIPGPFSNGSVDSYRIKAVPTAPCVTAYQDYTLDSNNPSIVSSQSFLSPNPIDPLTQAVLNTLGSGNAGALSSCGN